MNLSEELKDAFDQFVSSQISKDFLRSIVAKVDERDVDILVEAVERLDDPSEYCQDDYDDKTVTGFFLYIDFISALLINLGEPATKLLSKYAGCKHPYVPWIIKYAEDSRFHNDIMAKFSDVF